MNDDELNQTYAAERTAGSQQRSVVPQRRKHSPLMVLMACAGAMSAGMYAASSKGEVLMVDDLRPRKHESGLEVTAADVEAIKKAEAKRGRKALAKTKRHNE